MKQSGHVSERTNRTLFVLLSLFLRRETVSSEILHSDSARVTGPLVTLKFVRTRQSVLSLTAEESVCYLLLDTRGETLGQTD